MWPMIIKIHEVLKVYPCSRLDSLDGQVEQVRGNHTCARVFRIQRGYKRRWRASEILLVMDETLREKGNISLGNVVDYRPGATVLLGKAHA